MNRSYTNLELLIFSLHTWWIWGYNSAKILTIPELINNDHWDQLVPILICFVCWVNTHKCWELLKQSGLELVHQDEEKFSSVWSGYLSSFIPHGLQAIAELGSSSSSSLTILSTDTASLCHFLNHRCYLPIELLQPTATGGPFDSLQGCTGFILASGVDINYAELLFKTNFSLCFCVYTYIYRVYSVWILFPVAISWPG